MKPDKQAHIAIVIIACADMYRKTALYIPSFMNTARLTDTVNPIVRTSFPCIAGFKVPNRMQLAR